MCFDPSHAANPHDPPFEYSISKLGQRNVSFHKTWENTIRQVFQPTHLQIDVTQFLIPNTKTETTPNKSTPQQLHQPRDDTCNVLKREQDSFLANSENKDLPIEPIEPVCLGEIECALPPPTRFKQVGRAAVRFSDLPGTAALKYVADCNKYKAAHRKAVAKELAAIDPQSQGVPYLEMEEWRPLFALKKDMGLGEEGS
jgi:hypothetical protein